MCPTGLSLYLSYQHKPDMTATGLELVTTAPVRSINDESTGLGGVRSPTEY